MYIHTVNDKRDRKSDAAKKEDMKQNISFLSNHFLIVYKHKTEILCRHCFVSFTIINRVSYKKALRRVVF